MSEVKVTVEGGTLATVTLEVDGHTEHGHVRPVMTWAQAHHPDAVPLIRDALAAWRGEWAEVDRLVDRKSSQSLQDRYTSPRQARALLAWCEEHGYTYPANQVPKRCLARLTSPGHRCQPGRCTTIPGMDHPVTVRRADGSGVAYLSQEYPKATRDPALPQLHPDAPYGHGTWWALYDDAWARAQQAVTVS